MNTTYFTTEHTFITVRGGRTKRTAVAAARKAFGVTNVRLSPLDSNCISWAVTADGKRIGQIGACRLAS